MVCKGEGEGEGSDLQAWPKSWMPVEASCVKLFPRTLPAQLLMAHISGFKFHKLVAQPTAPAMC
jgi:hypothetical protein